MMILLGALSLNSAFASKLSIDLTPQSTDKMPASDLVYQGSQIDEIAALELIQSGVDISKLNPVESNLWKNKKLKASNQQDLAYPKKPKLVLKQFKASPSEIFRAVVYEKGNLEKQYVLVASLDNHTNILRASMLRLLGYDLDVPKYYPEIRIKFADKKERDQFVELVGEQTLTKRDRWVKKTISDTELIIKGFTLEPAELRNVNIHLPLMSRQRQQDRRVFRALLDIYMLTDFTQEINKIGWKVGRVFNNKLMFNHPYAREFNNLTLDDLRWIHRKINKLTENEIKKALSLAQYPKDIEALLLEKLFSRINEISKYINLTEKFNVNKYITLGNVKGGKLTKGGYDSYVPQFYNDDELNPYRFSEIFKLFRTQITYSSLGGLLDLAIDRFVPGLSFQDALADVQEKITTFRQENPTPGGAMPVKAFASPIANGRVFANRNIVFGQYLGSTAPIQLVDSVGVEASIGGFSTITGLSNTILPNLSATASVGRTYVHVRAMPDLSTASGQKIKKIFVPGLLKKLGRVIKDEFACSISKEPYVEESELNGSKIYYVKYDKSITDGRKLAIAKRKELIDSGVSASIILIIPIDRQKLCVDEIAEDRKKNISDFLKEFANNETFIINDTIRLSGRTTAPIPIPNVPGASVTLGMDHNVALMRSIMIRKVDESMEVTIQQQRDLRNGLSQGLSYFIEILNNSNSWTKGKLYSKVFKIKLNDLTEEKEEIALQTLRSLFVNNDRYLLHENYKGTDLDHTVKTHLHTFRFLWFKSQKLKMNHVVDIIVPNFKGQDFSEKERTRRLYSTMIMRRKGNDFHAFIDRAVGSLVGFISLGSTDQDPGQSFFGNSKKRYYMTESELTEGRPLNPTTRIEYGFTGWKRKTHKLDKFFNEIEDMYSEYTENDLIDRSLFHASPVLRSYDIKSTIIVYPSAFEKLKQFVFSTKREVIAMNALYRMYGEEQWQDFCKRAVDFFGEHGPQTYYGEKFYSCVPPEVKDMLEYRNKLPKDKIKLTKFVNKLYETLFEHYNKAKVLEFLGKENFFSSTRVTGFREQHHEGYLEYISDTVGEYNLKIGTGLFDAIGGHLGISPFELKAMSYTPGM